MRDEEWMWKDIFPHLHIGATMSVQPSDFDTAEAERQLQTLLAQLCTTFQVDEAALRSHQNMPLLFEEHVCPKERYCPAFNAPLFAGNVHLDFESKDADGEFSAPEASLKSFVFISTGPRHVTVARGASRSPSRPHPVHGVSGMAGVGKTTALIGLGHDQDIQAHFTDGVLYMTIGANATVGHITTELWKIMSVTGATTKASAVLSANSLADAITIATVWFHGKRVLFLIDDIWPTPTRPEGYLPEMQALLQGSPKSRMAISTRSLEIASKRGSHIDFGARDPCGQSSIAMFLAHVFPEAPASDQLMELARPVLNLCAGLPISLSVAGAAVAFHMSLGDDFGDACEAYVENIQAQTDLHPGASFLDNAIRISLAALSEDGRKHGRELGDKTEYSLRDLYTSLCVLESQQFVPVSVLARMWNLSPVIAEDVCRSFTSMSLAKTPIQMFDGRNQRGLTIHDLHLDFGRENARKRGEERVWHQRLLEGHLTLDASLNTNTDFHGVDDLSGFNILDHTPRSWWREDTPNREYIRRNLSRHLRGAGHELELGSTMLDIRWLAFQGAAGGVLGVNTDMNILQNSIQEKGKLLGTDDPALSVTIISNIAVGMGEMLQEGVRVICHELYAQLAGLSQTNEWIFRFLERMKGATPSPFLVPAISLYKRPVQDQKLDLELNMPGQSGFAYLSTEFSACNKFCAAAANHDIAVYNVENMSRLKCLKGHEENVSVVKFSSNASRLISGSVDKRVIVWDWNETESPLFVLKGHDGTVSSLSLSADDQRIFSGSMDGTVRVWDLTTGKHLRRIVNGTGVECVSSCPSNELIAVGTSDGYLRCTNPESGECVFEKRIDDDGAVSAVQFGPKGNLLISGTSSGIAARWDTLSWEMSSSVSIPGSVTHVSFHLDGANAILGTSKGEIRHWHMHEKELAKYNVAMARPLNGLAFYNSGSDIIAAVKNGYARAWSGPKSNPFLDFSAFRNNILFDFELSADGTRVATSTYDCMIRLWNTNTGTQIVEYSAPMGDSQRLALSRDGKKIASSSCIGLIQIWNPEVAPTDADMFFKVGEKRPVCLSFSPDGSKLLVCLRHEVEIWGLESNGEKLGQIPSFGCSNTSFSANGQLIIVGNHERTCIWDSSDTRIVFDSEDTASQVLSLSEAKHTIRTCGPSAIRMFPSILRSAKPASCLFQSLTRLTVDNIFLFVSCLFRPSNMQFSDSVFVLNFNGLLSIYKLQV